MFGLSDSDESLREICSNFFNIQFLTAEDSLDRMLFGWNKKYINFFTQLQRAKCIRRVIHEIAKFNLGMRYSPTMILRLIRQKLTIE